MERGGPRKGVVRDIRAYVETLLSRRLEIWGKFGLTGPNIDATETFSVNCTIFAANISGNFRDIET